MAQSWFLAFFQAFDAGRDIPIVVEQRRLVRVVYLYRSLLVVLETR